MLMLPMEVKLFYNPFKKSVKSKSGKITKRWYYWWVDPITGVQHQKVVPNVSNIAEAYAYVNSLPLPEKPGTQKPKIKDIAKEMFLPESNHVQRINQMGKKIAPRTITNNRHFVELVVEQFGENYLEDLTIPMVNGYLMTIEDKSGSWKNSFIEAVNSIYKEAPWHCNYTITKPEFPRFARNSKKADIFTTEELASFFDGANWSDGLREYLLFLTIAKCGLRLGEARALRVKQFVPDKNALVIDGFCERDEHRTNYNKKGSDEDQKLRVTLVPEDTMRVLMSYIRQHHLTRMILFFRMIWDYHYDRSFLNLFSKEF